MSEPAEVAVSAGANEERGEVDLVLDGARFVLRPSHEACLEIEKQTRKGLMQLGIEASDGLTSITEAAAITGAFIRAWGKQVDDPVASRVDNERIGELIYAYGMMPVVLRIAMVLKNALTGGCNADGTPKEGEAKPPMGTAAAPIGGTPASRQSRSGGRRTSTGRQPRTNSGARSKSGAK
jgi:hypothetical protein